MLNGSLLELETRVDEAPERDLGVVGGANAFVAFTGGVGSQVVLPTSLALQQLVPGSRVPAYVTAAVSLVAAGVAAPVLPYLPRPIFAALLKFYGVRCLEQYVRDAARAMSRGETTIVMAMLLGDRHLFFRSTSAIEAALRPLVERVPAHETLVLDFALVERRRHLGRTRLRAGGRRHEARDRARASRQRRPRRG